MARNKLKPRADGRYRKIVNGIAFYGYSEREINQKILAYQEKKEKGPLFSEVADIWWEEAYENLANQSIRVYKPALARALDEFGKTRIKEIEPKDLSMFFRIMAAQKFSQKTISNQKIVLNQIFNTALYNGDIKVNPCTAVQLPKNLKRTERYPATEEEEYKILTSTHSWLFPLFSLLTGLRKGEILALQWKDIHFKESTISVTKSVEHIGNSPNIKCPKTAAGVRDVPLVDILAKKLLPLRSASENYIFSDDNGKTPLTKKRYDTLYNQYCKEVGIKCTAHQIRHSYATIAVEQDVGVKELQNVLGHASVTMTLDVYVKNRKKSVKKLGEKLNAFYNNVENNK